MKEDFFDWVVQKEKMLKKYPTPWQWMERAYNPIALICAYLALLKELGIDTLFYAIRYGSEAAIASALEILPGAGIFMFIGLDPIVMGLVVLAIMFGLLAKKYCRKGRRALIIAVIVGVSDMVNVGTILMVITASIGDVIGTLLGLL